MPVMALCIVLQAMAAARALQAATAGRTSYGQARLQQQVLTHTTEILKQVTSLRMLGYRTILPTPFLCAVSWM